jgi:hypothetical protein
MKIPPTIANNTIWDIRNKVTKVLVTATHHIRKDAQKLRRQDVDIHVQLRCNI